MTTPFSTPLPPSPLRIRREAMLALVLLAAVVGALVFVAVRGFEVISASRAFVNGEGRWSKGQKEAVLHLSRYAHTADPGDWEAYQAAISIPLAARAAAAALAADPPDYERAAEGFRAGGSHPDDLRRMIWFIERFDRVPPVRRSLGIWGEADSLIGRIEELGAAIHAERLGAARADRLAALEEELHAVDGNLAAMEPEFSAAIGEAARWGQRRLTLFTIVTGLVLLGVTGLLTWLAARRFESQQQVLLESEREFRRVFEGARHGIMRSTVDGRILAANSALAEMLGYDSLEELLGRNVNRDLYAVPGERERILADAERTGVPDITEVTWRRSDGGLITVRITGQLIRDAQGRLVETEVFVEDVSERRALEARLRQAQKMEAIGLLAGGIAHDFNNLLTVMLSTATLLAEAIDQAHPTAGEDLASLRRSAQRGAAMVRKLMAFGRAGQVRPAPLDLRRAVTESAEVLRRVLPSTIRIELTLAPDTPIVAADEGALEQALLNLATNARDAMPQGGVLELATGSVELEEGRVVEGRMVGPGRFGWLAVRDSGVGMDSATLERLFDPFFTTKPPGEGTGLGAAMVYGLVAQQGGLVEASSVPGTGTEVRLLLPATMHLPAGEAPAQAGAGGLEHLLLVEDDPTVQQTTARVLRRAGYEVTVAADGHEALTALGQGRFDLVVSDVVMARVGGLALHREARARGHAVPFLFLSGYTGGEMTGGPAIPPDAILVRKPWTIDELLDTIRRRLGR